MVLGESKMKWTLRYSTVLFSTILGWTRGALAQDPPLSSVGRFLVPDGGGASAAVLGQNFTFEWISFQTQDDLISLSLRRGDPDGEFTRIAMIADRVPNTGSYTWEVPTTFFPEIDYYVILRTTAGFASMVSQNFRINPPGSPVIGATPSGVTSIPFSIIDGNPSRVTSIPFSIIESNPSFLATITTINDFPPDSATRIPISVSSGTTDPIAIFPSPESPTEGTVLTPSSPKEIVPLGVKVVVIIAGAVVAAGLVFLAVYLAKRKTRKMIEAERERVLREKEAALEAASAVSSPSSEMEGVSTLSSLRAPPAYEDAKMRPLSTRVSTRYSRRSRRSTIRHELPVDPIELDSTPTDTSPPKRFSESTKSFKLGPTPSTETSYSKRFSESSYSSYTTSTGSLSDSNFSLPLHNNRDSEIEFRDETLRDPESPENSHRPGYI